MSSSNVKTLSAELFQARQWWAGLEEQWKIAFNEATLERGATSELPEDGELMEVRYTLDTFRFAGPDAQSANLSIRLTNLSGLVDLRQLSFLSLTDCDIRGIEELKDNVHLKDLFLYNNQITSLRGIEEATDLEELYVQNNRLTDLKALHKLTKLRTLCASGNEISSLEGLHEGHSEQMKRCFLLPNDKLSQREIIRLQNEAFIMVKKG